MMTIDTQAETMRRVMALAGRHSAEIFYRDDYPPAVEFASGEVSAVFHSRHGDVWATFTADGQATTRRVDSPAAADAVVNRIFA